MMKYSIVIPTYNRMYITAGVVYNFLHLFKDRNDFEILIINDGSTDETLTVMQSIQKINSHIRIINSDKENGEYRNPGFARNVGIKFAQGDFICFCDGDIFHVLNPLEKMDEITEKYAKDSFYVTGVFMRTSSLGDCTGPHGYNTNMPHGSWLATSKDNLINIGGYDERFKIYGNEDHDIVQRLERKGLLHISAKEILGIHPFFDAGRDDTRQPEIIKKLQMEIQREISIIRNESKQWGNGYEVLSQDIDEPNIKTSSNQHQSDDFKLQNYDFLSNTIQNLDNSLEILSEDSKKISKILHLCINLNSGLIAHQQGIFKGKKHSGFFPFGKEVFRFVKNSNGSTYSDLPDFKGNLAKISDSQPESIDLIILSQLHRQRNVGIYLDTAFLNLKTGGELVMCVPAYSNCIGSGNTNNLWNAGTLLYNLVLAGFDCKLAKLSTFTNEIQLYLTKTDRTVPKSIALATLNDFFPNEVFQHFDGNILEINWN